MVPRPDLAHCLLVKAPELQINFIIVKIYLNYYIFMLLQYRFGEAE